MRLLTGIGARILPAQPLLTARVLSETKHMVGLEIGGPSRVFNRGKILPVYPSAARIDNVNFASATAWESGLRDGGTFMIGSSKIEGRQYLREAVHLKDLPNTPYDFILSSHCLEHVANPLAALFEWRRVTRDNGHLILILPNPSDTFDHRRPLTTLEHLRKDFADQRAEDDLSHLPEILSLHDLARDPHAGSPQQFRTRSERNFENRCLHHHVFDFELIRAMLNDAGWDVLETEYARPMHLIAFAKKGMLA